MIRPVVWWWVHPKYGALYRVERITKPSVGGVDSTVLVHRCTDDGRPLGGQPERILTRDLVMG
jgi:hypothetical protein